MEFVHIGSSELVKKIENEKGIHIGGCPKCQPNATMAEGWKTLSQEIIDALLGSKVYCCTELDTNGRVIYNHPIYCEVS